MQMPRTLTQPSRFNKLAAGLLIAAVALASIVGLSQLQRVDNPTFETAGTSRPAIVAHGSMLQGEGRIDGAIVAADSAAVRPMVRYAPVNAGEGLVDPSILSATTQSRIVARVDPMADEGRLEAALLSLKEIAFLAEQQGEGLIDPAN